MVEIWKDIKEYEGFYKISNIGNVYSVKRKKVLSPRYNKARGYLDVLLTRNKKTKRFYIHRLVAKEFILNPNNYPIINHKDENKLNNNMENLEWCTVKYNNNYGSAKYKRALSLRKSQNKTELFLEKEIEQYDLNENIIANWKSIKEAKIKTGAKHISEVCKGKRKTSGGYIWKYKT